MRHGMNTQGNTTIEAIEDIAATLEEGHTIKAIGGIDLEPYASIEAGDRGVVVCKTPESTIICLERYHCHLGQWGNTIEIFPDDEGDEMLSKIVITGRVTGPALEAVIKGGALTLAEVTALFA
jgi:hypothetical protein